MLSSLKNIFTGLSIVAGYIARTAAAKYTEYFTWWHIGQKENDFSGHMLAEAISCRLKDDRVDIFSRVKPLPFLP